MVFGFRPESRSSSTGFPKTSDKCGGDAHEAWKPHAEAWNAFQSDLRRSDDADIADADADIPDIDYGPLSLNLNDLLTKHSVLSNCA